MAVTGKPEGGGGLGTLPQKIFLFRNAKDAFSNDLREKKLSRNYQ